MSNYMTLKKARLIDASADDFYTNLTISLNNIYQAFAYDKMTCRWDTAPELEPGEFKELCRSWNLDSRTAWENLTYLLDGFRQGFEDYSDNL